MCTYKDSNLLFNIFYLQEWFRLKYIPGINNANFLTAFNSLDVTFFSCNIPLARNKTSWVQQRILWSLKYTTKATTSL